jgi:hypothetical protein
VSITYQIKDRTIVRLDDKAETEIIIANITDSGDLLATEGNGKYLAPAKRMLRESDPEAFELEPEAAPAVSVSIAGEYTNQDAQTPPDPPSDPSDPIREALRVLKAAGLPVENITLDSAPPRRDRGFPVEPDYLKLYPGNIDGRAGDKDVGFLRWMQTNHPLAFQARYKHRKIEMDPQEHRVAQIRLARPHGHETPAYELAKELLIDITRGLATVEGSGIAQYPLEVAHIESQIIQ